MSTQIRPVIMAILAMLTAFHVLPDDVYTFLHDHVDDVVATIVLIWSAVAAYKNHKIKNLKKELE